MFQNILRKCRYLKGDGKTAFSIPLHRNEEIEKKMKYE